MESPTVPPAIWLTVKEAAARARVSPSTIYHEVRAGRLRAARIGGRRDLRFREGYIDAWLEASATPHDVESWSRRDQPESLLQAKRRA